MVLQQLKDPLEPFLKRWEFLPGSGSHCDIMIHFVITCIKKMSITFDSCPSIYIEIFDYLIVIDISRNSRPMNLDVLNVMFGY